MALCGSLRAQSSNRALLQAARLLVPAGIELVLFEGLARLPPFNPDFEEGGGPLPAEVRTLRAEVGRAEVMLIACPEYAHGVPGAFKNLLDWLVGGAELPGKPVALLNAAARAHHAQDQLYETLATMAARHLGPAPWCVPLPHNRFDAAAILDNRDIATTLRATLTEIAALLAD